MSSLSVSVIQSSLHWEDKSANLQMFEGKINSIKEPTELVILPEMFNTGFSMQPEKLGEPMDGPTIQWMKAIAKKKNVVLAGSLIIKDGDDYFNRLIWMLPSGQYGWYDKRHRFAYGGEDKQFAAGEKRLIASVNGWKVQLLVCYDLRFPVWARQQPSNGEGFEYDVLVYVANWPDRRIHAWRTLLQARAIENQCYVIGCNRVGEDGNNICYSGSSMIVGPIGEILYEKKEDEDIITYKLQKEKLVEVRTGFPFWKDADSFQILNQP